MSSANPFDAVFKMYHDAPVTVLLNKSVVSFSRKNGRIGWFSSSTMLASAAAARPEVEAGPSKPMVPYVSEANSGNATKKAGLMPEGFQLAFNALLYTPAGAERIKGASLFPNTALMRSPGLGRVT